MARLRYLESARTDVLDILEYVTRQSGSLATGRRFVGLLQQKCRDLAALPGQMGRPRPELRPDIRSVSYRGYLIFFRYGDQVFEVVNVLEGRMDFDRHFEHDLGE